MNDVDISPNPKSLFFDKHVEYIAHHGNDKNDYVCSVFSLIDLNWAIKSLCVGILHDRVLANVRHILGCHSAGSDG